MKLIKLGLGGSCHWCTEAIFQSITGVTTVDQGWISSKEKLAFSEAVVVHFDPDLVSLLDLIKIHLHSHSSTSDHSMREKYRSAVYVYDVRQESLAKMALDELRSDFSEDLVTEVLHFDAFKKNSDQYLNYYYSDSSKQFCSTTIRPKLEKLIQQFPNQVDVNKAKSSF